MVVVLVVYFFGLVVGVFDLVECFFDYFVGGVFIEEVFVVGYFDVEVFVVGYVEDGCECVWELNLVFVDFVDDEWVGVFGEVS